MRKGLSYSEAGKNGYEKSKDKLEKRNQEFKDSYYKDPSQCKECGEVIPYENRRNSFCNSSCSATYINQRRNRKDARKIRKCACCGKKTKNPKYCNLKCQGEHRWNLIEEKIEESKVFPNSNKTIRKYLLKKNGTQCIICSRKTWQGKPIPLEVDHIDGNSENNNVSNLRMVCGNCGMQLPTYKGKNVGNGRHSRRQRYKEGKSY